MYLLKNVIDICLKIYNRYNTIKYMI